ncbi:MAG: flavin-containing monooxygenase [Steroidobacteraceae bacterium]|jgi:cation diffusion facilitator CzcD-associated flavoprotein CzcO
MSSEVLDVLIVGAGLSGIGAAAEIRRQFPGKAIAILESRDRLGGTWDLFRYPGIRSDSDMYTLGFKAKPWRKPRAIVDGSSILNYLREMADESGVASLIRYGQQVESADWSSARCEWTVNVRTREDGLVTLRARFLHLCTGYYSYTEAYRPTFEGESDFRGKIIHPQFWPENFDYGGKRVVVIGSGATAITLVPALAEKAAHVTQLQRTPSYVVNQPGDDPWARVLSYILPAPMVYGFVRWKHILLTSFFYRLARKYPRWFGQRLVELAAADLPKGYDVARHFKPNYNPWDQRVCAAPDGDLFQAISKGRVSIVTDTIERFVPDGIRLRSGETLPADVVVTATGLKVLPLGGIRLSLDGRTVDLAESMVYRGAMLSGIPNLVLTFGYTNASWTLRADLIAAYVCRLLGHLDRHGYQYAVPVRDPSVGEMPFIDFNSGYVLRALEGLPKQGDRFPWRVHQTYLRDLGVTRYSRLTDPALRFGRATDPTHA